MPLIQDVDQRWPANEMLEKIQHFLAILERVDSERHQELKLSWLDKVFEYLNPECLSWKKSIYRIRLYAVGEQVDVLEDLVSLLPSLPLALGFLEVLGDVNRLLMRFNLQEEDFDRKLEWMDTYWGPTKKAIEARLQAFSDSVVVVNQTLSEIHSQNEGDPNRVNPEE